MSFITKRERVFNDYDLCDLPGRNEGKLKAYASCTDARAWSHFTSDKSEHLVEIIKRNNEVCRPKYVPTNVIVDTLMVAKNAEISRLKRRIEEFEQMVAAYDQLDLSRDQKYEIEKAHAAIRAANKDLEELYLDLDVSGFTEQSEGFETGKSRGDETSKSRGDEFVQEQPPIMETKAVQISPPITNEVATYAKDPRIEEMLDSIIIKDAKLNAMKNTIAVMENDVCEPYCIYAHIYTALEKIFGVLCQNDRYRQYLNLLTAGKDTRCIDIKGKILFKLKVLEKFGCALIAPCCQEFTDDYAHQHQEECACYRVEVMPRIEHSFALTTDEATLPNHDTKRAHLVADIIQNDEMKEILSKESNQQSEQENDNNELENYNIETENLNRLKNLQVNYDDLMSCYELLKHEKICLEIRCRNYEELEEEYENLKVKMREYDSVWNEKEHYRKRSIDLDKLKEQYLILTDETSNIETQLKAEKEIKNIKSKTIDDLRKENIALEKKLNEASMGYEKEKNSLLCRLKEADCRVMCQEQQIRSLAIQMDRLLEQVEDKTHAGETEANSIALLDEIESSKEQIKNLKDALFCNEQEKQDLHQQYQEQLTLINALRMEMEDWKSTYENTVQRNDYLEKYTENLSQELKEKSIAVDNLMNVITHKSVEINELRQEVESKKDENKDLFKQLNELQTNYENCISSMENEKKHLRDSLQLARRESLGLMEKVNGYDENPIQEDDTANSSNLREIEQLQCLLMKTIEENKNLKVDLHNRELYNSQLLEDIKKIRHSNDSLLNENSQYETSLQLTQKECNELRENLLKLDNLAQQLDTLQNAHNKLQEKHEALQNELNDKTYDLENAMHCIQISKKESDELIQESDNIKNELLRLSEAYNKLSNEKHTMQRDLAEKKILIDRLMQDLDNLRLQNEKLFQKCKQCDDLEKELFNIKKTCEDLIKEKDTLLADFNNKSEEINYLHNTLERKVDENRELIDRMKIYEITQAATQHNLTTLQNEQSTTQSVLKMTKKESLELMGQLKSVENEFDELKRAHDQIKVEKERLQRELENKEAHFNKIQQENYELVNQNQNILSYNEDIEHSLINARTQLIDTTKSVEDPYKDIMPVIEELKQEKEDNQKKIRDLLDTLDKSEYIILNLKEELQARNDKIAILENHINQLKNEVKILHTDLDKVVDTGEQLKNFSFQEIDTLKNMEAHHSRATHNIKMELAKIKYDNSKLEEQLSVTKVKSDEYTRDKNKYVSQIIQLQNEREIIVSDIRQLELRSVGDSALIPDKCEVQDILLSLDKIGKCLEARNSKSSSLQQTLLKVQTSSQLLLSKADEAKKIIEIEKQKIITEKEEAIKDRQNMEKQLLKMKENLEKQITDQTVIKDLKATVLNKELIIDKIKQSTDDYISKLRSELQDLQELYQMSIEKIEELEEKVGRMSEDGTKYRCEIEQFKVDFGVKSKEITALQNQLNELRNKPVREIGVQVEVAYLSNSKGTQVAKEIVFDEKEKPQKVQLDEKKVESAEELISNEIKNNILTTYINTKLQRLRLGELEYHSLPDPTDTKINEDSVQMKDVGTTTGNSTNSRVYTKTQIIYKKPSMSTNTSVGHEESGNKIIIKPAYHNIIKSKGFNKNKIHKNDSVNLNKISKEVGPDQEQFLIYRDNDNIYNKNENTKSTWSDNGNPEVIVETLTVHPTNYREHSELKPSETSKRKDSYIDITDEEDDSIRPILHVEIPRIRIESHSAGTISAREIKSSDSYYNLSTHSTRQTLSESGTKINNAITNSETFRSRSPSQPTISNEESSFVEDNNSIKLRSDKYLRIVKKKTRQLESPSKQKRKTLKRKENQFSYDSESQCDVSKKIVKTQRISNKRTDKQKPGRFGLEYILDSVQGEVNPKDVDYEKQKFRKSKSDESLSLHKIGEVYNRSSKESPIEYNIMSTSSKYSNRSQTKTFAERSIMAKIDSNKVEYETKIKYLTQALDSISKNYEKKIEAIKEQYDSNIKSIIIEHNHGVKSIQDLHEETLQDILKVHENEVDNLRSMSIEAMKKSAKLEKENRLLKTKCHECNTTLLDKEPTKMPAPETKKRKKCEAETKMLTRTLVEAFNVNPKLRSQGPCTCSLEANLSDTIRNIFEQVDVEQRKMAERTYLKYIANKIKSGNVDTLDVQELSFLHLKICRTWKSRINKEEALQKRIDSLETELFRKQRNTQQHIEELDRKVAEERLRLQQVRDAVCRGSPTHSRSCSPAALKLDTPPAPPPTAATPERDLACGCNKAEEVGSRRSAGDITELPNSRPRDKRVRMDNTRAVLAKLTVEERRVKKLYNDEPPTRLRRTHERRSSARK